MDRAQVFENGIDIVLQHRNLKKEYCLSLGSNAIAIDSSCVRLIVWNGRSIRVKFIDAKLDESVDYDVNKFWFNEHIIPLDSIVYRSRFRGNICDIACVIEVEYIDGSLTITFTAA
jgi:hypothetical protein